MLGPHFYAFPKEAQRQNLDGNPQGCCIFASFASDIVKNMHSDNIRCKRCKNTYLYQYFKPWVCFLQEYKNALVFNFQAVAHFQAVENWCCICAALLCTAYFSWLNTCIFCSGTSASIHPPEEPYQCAFEVNFVVFFRVMRSFQVWFEIFFLHFGSYFWPIFRRKSPQKLTHKLGHIFMHPQRRPDSKILM